MSPQWVQELLFICLFFSVWDLSPPLSVTLLRDEGNKSNQTVAWRKTLNCNNRLCALKNSRHQTAKAGVYSIFVPADSYVLVGVIFFPWRQRSILFGEARICQCKTCILAYSTCLGIFFQTEELLHSMRMPLWTRVHSAVWPYRLSISTSVWLKALWTYACSKKCCPGEKGRRKLDFFFFFFSLVTMAGCSSCPCCAIFSITFSLSTTADGC